MYLKYFPILHKLDLNNENLTVIIKTFEKVINKINTRGRLAPELNEAIIEKEVYMFNDNEDVINWHRGC